MDTYTVQGDAWLTFHARLLFMCFGCGRWYGIDANPHLLCNGRRGPQIQVLQAPTDAECGHGVREW